LCSVQRKDAIRLNGPLAVRHHDDGGLFRHESRFSQGQAGGIKVWSAGLLTRRYPYGHPDPFRSVRDLRFVRVRCSSKSGEPQGRSSAWLPAWLPAAEHVRHHRPGARHHQRLPGSGSCRPPLLPIGLTAADPFAGGRCQGSICVYVDQAL
jgi:hypothetical protein